MPEYVHLMMTVIVYDKNHLDGLVYAISSPAVSDIARMVYLCAFQ